jgi:hypothetical protein
MRLGSQRQFAKELGCKQPYISNLVKNKDYRIIIVGKKIDIDKSLELMHSSGFGKRSAKSQTKTTEPKQTEIKKVQDSKEDIANGSELSIEDPRERIEKHKAFHQSEKERIANEEKKGELIKKSEVEDKSFNLWRQIRDGIQALGDRCAVKIRAAESDHEATRILNDESHRILKSIIASYDLNDEDVKKKLLSLLT